MVHSFRRKPLAAMAALTFAAAMPLAANAGSGPYIGAQAGANKVSPEDLISSGEIVTNTATHPGFMFGLETGYSFDNGLRPEVEFGYRKNDNATITSGLFGGTLPAAGHVDAGTAMGNLWYDFKRPSGFFNTFHPYLGGGVGLAFVEVNQSVPDDSTTPIHDGRKMLAYQGGAGFSYDITPVVAATLDYRYLITPSHKFVMQDTASISEDGMADYRYRSQSIGLGLRISFDQPAAPIAAAPAPMPVAVPVAVAPPPPPPPVKKCPNTPPGFKVDADGCIIQQTIVLHAVNFKTNSDVLTDADKAQIDPVVATLLPALQAQPSLHVEVDGHTDSRGSAAYNLKLSDKRANAVKDYLVSKGIAASQLSAHGFGQTKPVASNDTVDGRTQNRRVEFVVQGTAAPDTKIVTEGSTSAEQNSAVDASQPAAAPKKKAKAKAKAQPAATPAAPQSQSQPVQLQ